jgi:hypothetical protein
MLQQVWHEKELSLLKAASANRMLKIAALSSFMVTVAK